MGMVFSNKILIFVLGFALIILMIFLTGYFYDGWVYNNQSGRDNFGSWIYAITPYSYVGTMLVRSRTGLVTWWEVLNSLIITLGFLFIMLATSRYWFSYASIR